MHIGVTLAVRNVNESLETQNFLIDFEFENLRACRYSSRSVDCGRGSMSISGALSVDHKAHRPIPYVLYPAAVW